MYVDNINNENVQIHIDYLAFTIPLESDIDVVNAFEKIKEELANLFYMTSFDYGELHNFFVDNYEYNLSLGENINIRFGGEATKTRKILDYGNDDNSILKSIDKYDSLMVEIKGQGCREIEFLSGGKINYIEIIKWVESKGGKFTRIDIAIDDMKGDVIKLEKILEIVSKGLYTSAYRSKPIINGSILKKDNYLNINVDDEPCTLYFGRNSDKVLCIYNKKAERLNNNDSFLGNYWVRFEMRFKHDNADNVAYFLKKNNMSDIGDFACSQLKKLLTLRCKKYNGKLSDCKNIRMLDIEPAWEKFLTYVEGTSFSVRPILESSIDKKIEWRTSSLTKQLILLDIADGYDESEWIISGLGRLYKEKQDQLNYLLEKRNKIYMTDLRMIDNYRRKQKNNILLENLSDKDINEYIEKLKCDIKYMEENFKLPF